MSFDYTKIALVVRTKIAQFGRAVEFVKLDRDAVDSAKPWRGATDPRATPESTIATNVVVADPGSLSALGMTVAIEDLIKRSKMILMAPPETDLEGYDEVWDRGERWRIVGVQKLEPGETVLLYFVGVTK